MSRKRFSDYVFRSYRKRKIINLLMSGVLLLCSLAVLVPLGSVFIYVFQKGFAALNLSFFTELPVPVGEVGGGVGNAILGSFVLVVLASLVAVPWGVALGIFLAEYGRGKIAALTRVCVDLLTSTPSIVIGLFVYSLVVMPMKRFSALAGGLALALIMIPIIARTSEEMLLLVPKSIREAGLALGLPRWKVILRIVVQGSLGSLSTGVLLAIARAAGESAPLLFTSFNNQFWQRGLDQPIAALPVQIYTYAISPFEDWHQKAWGSALVLVFLVFCVNLLARGVLMARRSSARPQ